MKKINEMLSSRAVPYPGLRAAWWVMGSELHAGKGLVGPHYLVRGKNPSCPEASAWVLTQRDQMLRN